MGLSDTRITTPERRDRILLVGAIAAALLTLLGAAGEAVGEDRRMKANTSKERTHSLLNQGLFYFDCLPGMREERAKPLMAKFDELFVNTPRSVKSSASYEGMAQGLMMSGAPEFGRDLRPNSGAPDGARSGASVSQRIVSWTRPRARSGRAASSIAANQDLRNLSSDERDPHVRAVVEDVVGNPTRERI